MAELTFGCTGAHVVRYAATPTFALSLNITESTGVRLHAIALRCQIRIEPHRRRYTADEARRLHELFGDTHSWAEPANPLHLATLTALVPGFTSRTEVDLQVPCSYDLEVASARYLQVLEDGILPLLLLFSGTVFVDHGHTYSVELIPWSLEVPFPMPIRVWHDVVEQHFPGSAWLRCSRQTLDALAGFKSAYALPTWDATLSALLEAARVPWDPSASPDMVAGPPDRQDAVQEPQAAATEPVGTAPEPQDGLPQPQDSPPEVQDAAAEDAAPEDAALEYAAPDEAAPDEAAPEQAAPEQAAPEERHPTTGRRRTGTAVRRPAVRRTAKDPAPEDRDKPRRGKPAGHNGDGGGSDAPSVPAARGPGTRSPLSRSPDSR